LIYLLSVGLFSDTVLFAALAGYITGIGLSFRQFSQVSDYNVVWPRESWPSLRYGESRPVMVQLQAASYWGQWRHSLAGWSDV